MIALARFAAQLCEQLNKLQFSRHKKCISRYILYIRLGQYDTCCASVAKTHVT